MTTDNDRAEPMKLPVMPIPKNADDAMFIDALVVACAGRENIAIDQHRAALRQRFNDLRAEVEASRPAPALAPTLGDEERKGHVTEWAQQVCNNKLHPVRMADLVEKLYAPAAKEGVASPVVSRGAIGYVPHCHTDGENCIVGEVRWDEVREMPFEMATPEHWECRALYFAPSQDQREVVAPGAAQNSRADFCHLIDELLASWRIPTLPRLSKDAQDVENTPEKRQRRMDARAALEGAIDSLRQSEAAGAAQPVAWLCEFEREDGTTDMRLVLEDPEGTRWADSADGDGVSPYSVVPLYDHPDLSVTRNLRATDTPTAAPEGWREAQLVEAIAKVIYRQWVAAPGYVAWVEGGNSRNQDDARRLAHEAIEASEVEQVEPRTVRMPLKEEQKNG
jgi:hypothetical protein